MLWNYNFLFTFHWLLLENVAEHIRVLLLNGACAHSLDHARQGWIQEFKQRGFNLREKAIPQGAVGIPRGYLNVLHNSRNAYNTMNF